MNKSHDKLAQRLSLILTKLNGGERFTTIELSEEFNVSIRTIQRDLKERLSFLPIEKHGDYYSLEKYALGKLCLNDIKSFATLSGIKSLYPSLTDEFITEVLNTKLNPIYLVKSQGFQDISHKQDYFEVLSTAILKSVSVCFEYKDKYRNVNPYKLVNNDGIWYLLADEDNRLKTFSLSKVKDVDALDYLKVFSPKQEFLNQISQNNINWFTVDELTEVTLKVDNKAKEYFNRKNILPNKKVIKEDSNYFTVKTKVSFDDEILKLVKYWIPYIKIVEPKYLQQKLGDELRRYSEEYEIY